MKRKGRVVGVVLLLALYATVAPARAAGWGGREEAAGRQGYWAALWQRAVCFVNSGCRDLDGVSLGEQRQGSPQSIFSENGMCIDPNGGPSPKACAEIQSLEPRVHQDR